MRLHRGCRHNTWLSFLDGTGIQYYYIRGDAACLKYLGGVPKSTAKLTRNLGLATLGFCFRWSLTPRRDALNLCGSLGKNAQGVMAVCSATGFAED